MMFCKKCGKTLKDDAKFCPFCGAQTAGSAGVGATTGATGVGATTGAAGGLGFQVPTPKPRQGKSLILGIVAAAAVVCVAAGVMISGVLGSPQDKVEKALEKTMSAYSKVAEDMGMTVLSQLEEKKSYSTDVSVALKELPSSLSYYYDASVLEGLGMRMGTDLDLESRAMSMTAAAFYGSADLVQASLSLDNTVLAVYSPQFLGDRALGMDTMTLGADLADLDPDNKDMYKNISFNLFDFLDKFTQEPEVDKEALKALRDAIEVEETGKETVEVNGSSVDCTGYSVLIPEDALRDYMDAVEDSMDALELDDAIIDLMESMGVPKDELDYMKDDIKEAVSGGAMFDAAKEFIKALGDVELQVYLSDGYVMAVEWEPKVDGTRLEIGLYFGGGKVYEDQLSLEISGGGMELLVESEGDHTASSGRYTDVTTITVSGGGSASFELESELEYEPGADSDNFYWSLGCDEFTLVAEGQLTVGKDSLDLTLDNLELESYGESLALEVSYSVGPYEKRETGAGEVLMIADMSQSDLEDLVWDIQSNAEDWIYDLMNEIPALQQLMWYL